MMLRNARDLPAGEERVFARLMISYSALEVDQKRMFLDVAYFFLWRRANTAINAWKRCGAWQKRANYCQLCDIAHIAVVGTCRVMHV